MVNAALFIVECKGDAIACRGGVGPEYPASRFGFIWHGVSRCEPPPGFLMTWETREGAQRFADMNGGSVTTVMDYFYGPRQTDAALPKFD